MTRLNIITTVLFLLIMNLWGSILMMHSIIRSTRLIKSSINMTMTPRRINPRNFSSDESKWSPERNCPGNTNQSNEYRSSLVGGYEKSAEHAKSEENVRKEPDLFESEAWYLKT
jgi:hypothetical protein